MKQELKEPSINEILPVPTKESQPANVIDHAIKTGATPEQLGKLLELQERWEANEAKKAYHKAMTAFKANPPDIVKNKKVAFGTTKYSHATLASVAGKVNAELSKHGLSASWKVSQNGQISVTCKITHEQGHSEETTLTAPADSSGSKNAIQQIGSTITYLERYTLLALTGLATYDMDDDGNGAGAEKITLDDVNSLMDHLHSIEASVPKFLEYMKLEKLEDMPKSDLKKAWTAIEGVKAKKAAKK